MKRAVTINLPTNGTPHDYALAISEAISANMFDGSNQLALSGLLACLNMPTASWSLQPDRNSASGFSVRHTPRS